ncbi:MAG: hypothetical protein JWR44_1231 [Hymenobacter sp.]|nr:hypothetical protein [Hymenobacter sp.]
MSKLITRNQPTRWLRLFYFLALLLPMTGQAQVVISQAYGGGGNAGSVYRNDFIELFNRGTTTVNVAGWTVQYASTTGTFSTANSTTLTGSIAPGKYYLIQEAAGTGGTTNLPTPDVTGTIAMGGTGFRLALVNNAAVATATAGPNSTFSGNVVDFLGSGAATAYEGATPAPAPSNTTSNVRAGAGCTDSNVNGNDFTAAAPNPRNSASPVNTCATPAEINVTDGSTTYLTASTYSGFAPTTVGSTDTKTFTIENTGGTALTISSILATGDFSVSGVPASVNPNSTATFSVSFAPTASGTRTGTLTITNSDSDEGTYVINLSGQGQASTANPEINVQVGGTNFLAGSTYNGFANTVTGASSAPVAFTIQNTSGTDALSLISIATTGDFSVSGVTTPASVPANGSVTVNVVFSPTATGTRSGTLVINSNDQDEATYTINLQGEGVNPVPTISTLAPSSATAGDPGFTLTVNGSGFVSGAVVSFNGTNRVTTFVSATQLTAAILAADVATAGSYNVVVTNPAPGGGASAAAVFTVNPLPAPTLTSINPATITAGQATTVTFTGTGFVSGATVSFNGNTLATTVVNGTTLTASITPPAQSATATYPVSVTTPGGTSGTQTLTATGVFVLTPISISAVNTPVTENFNTLVATGTAPKTTLPTGFDFVETDAGANEIYTAGTGSGTGGDTYSFGSTAADRAFGTLLSGSLTSTIGAAYTNNTGQTITSLAISYTGEEWRLGNAGRTDRLDFQYSTTATGVNTGTYVDFNGLDFVTPNTVTTGAKDGNAAANRTALSATITGISIPAGATFFIRWQDADAAGGADDGLAVDDLSLTANPGVATCGAPATPTFANITQTSANVQVTPGPNGSGPFTVTATPTTGPAITANGTTSPIALTGLTAGTSYQVTVTSICNTGFSSPSPASPAATLTTPAAPAPTLVVTQGATTIANNGSPSYNFGTQTTGTTQTVVFTLTNSGPDPLTISGIGATNSSVFNFSSFPTPTTVAANGGTASLTVTYTVGSGAQSGTIGITSDATNGNASFQLTLAGNGVAATPNPLIAVSQAGTGIANGGTFSGFASTTQSSTSAPVTFTISNASATDNLTIGTFTLTGPFALSGAQPTSVAPGGSATFSLTFSPTATGTNTGTLSIPNNSQANNPYLINLSGQGTAIPDLVVSNAQNVSGAYNNVTVTSTGVATLVGILTVNGTITVAGVLSGNCQSVTNNIKTVNGPGNFVLQAGGRLDICDAAGITTSGATGLIQVTGTRTYSPDATYAYLGGTAQVTGNGLPSQARAILVNNANGLTLSQAVAVAQRLALTSGNLTTAGNALTLLSAASGTAVVDNTGGIVNGTAAVQRYIDNPNPIGYRHYSAPVSNTTVNDLAAPGFSPAFNPAYNLSPTPGTVTPFPTVFGYNQDRIALVTSNYGPFDKGWFSPTAGDPMQVGRGYTVNAPNTALVDFVGNLNNGSQSSGFLSRGTDAAAGWHFLGNPYPAPLDWSTVAPAQRPGMDAAMYVFQSGGQYGGSYRSYANGIGGASPLIDVASGYFVRVSTTGTAGSVDLTNANRVTTFGAQPAFGRGAADSRPQLELQLRNATTGLDETYVYFETGATAGRDAQYDATKLANPSGLNLSSVAAGQEMAINGLPLLGTSAVIVPLQVAVPQAGNYTFNAADVANFTGSVTLTDALAGTRTVLTTGSSYAFTLAGTSAPGRFALEFRAAGVLASASAKALAAQVQLFPNPASVAFRVQLPLLRANAVVSATLTNALGQTVLNRTLSAPAGQAINAEFDVRALASGVYTLRLNVDGTPVVRKVVVE